MVQRMLAVDDEPDLLRLIERIVQRKTNYEIVTTNNSLEVPHILEEQEFDLIVVDLKMPGIDGMDILKLIKEQDRLEQVVICTAFGTLESALEAMSEGVFDFITKPFKKEQLLYSIEKVMSYQRARKEALHLKSIFEVYPYEKAQQAFKKEYLLRLKEKFKDNKEKIAGITGLPEEEIKVEFDKYKT